MRRPTNTTTTLSCPSSQTSTGAIPKSARPSTPPCASGSSVARARRRRLPHGRPVAPHQGRSVPQQPSQPRVDPRSLTLLEHASHLHRRPSRDPSDRRRDAHSHVSIPRARPHRRDLSPPPRPRRLLRLRPQHRTRVARPSAAPTCPSTSTSSRPSGTPTGSQPSSASTSPSSPPARGPTGFSAITTSVVSPPASARRRHASPPCSCSPCAEPPLSTTATSSA